MCVSHLWPEEADHLSNVKVLVCTQHVTCDLHRQITPRETIWFCKVPDGGTQQTESPYHHDVILQLAAAYSELQVSHGTETVLQCGAAIIYNVLHREVVGRGPALKVLVPDQKRTGAEWKCRIRSSWLIWRFHSLVCIRDQIHVCEQLAPGGKPHLHSGKGSIMTYEDSQHEETSYLVTRTCSLFPTKSQGFSCLQFQEVKPSVLRSGDCTSLFHRSGTRWRKSRWNKSKLLFHPHGLCTTYSCSGH